MVKRKTWGEIEMAHNQFVAKFIGEGEVPKKVIKTDAAKVNIMDLKDLQMKKSDEEKSFYRIIKDGFSDKKPNGKPKNEREIYNDKSLALNTIKDKADKGLGIVSRVSDILLMLGTLRTKPSKTHLVAAGAKIFDLFYQNILSKKLNPPAYEDPLVLYIGKLGGKWEDLFTNRSRIVEILNECELGKIVSEEENQSDYYYGPKGEKGSKTSTSAIYHAIIEECDIVWKQRKGKDTFVLHLMIRTDQKDRLFIAIGNLVWKSYNTNHLTAITNNLVNPSGFNSHYIEFMEDLFAKDILQSEIADKIAENTKRFLAVPEIEARAILLYGPPGTGKSTAARYIAHVLKFRSLRIGYNILSDGNTLIQCLDILRPDLIIIDDIDRSPNNGSLLETLELLRKRTKVIIASANYPGKLDYAVLRPGRFDEAIKIHILDNAVIKRTIGEDAQNEEVFNLLRGLPIAYINEYALRKKVLGEKEAAKSIKELHDRIELGNRADEDETDQNDYKLLAEQIKELRQSERKPKPKAKAKTAKKKSCKRA
jgi:hypothetical protein